MNKYQCKHEQYNTNIIPQYNTNMTKHQYNTNMTKHQYNTNMNKYQYKH